MTKALSTLGSLPRYGRSVPLEHLLSQHGEAHFQLGEPLTCKGEMENEEALPHLGGPKANVLTWGQKV